MFSFNCTLDAFLLSGKFDTDLLFRFGTSHKRSYQLGITHTHTTTKPNGRRIRPLWSKFRNNLDNHRTNSCAGPFHKWVFNSTKTSLKKKATKMDTKLQILPRQFERGKAFPPADDPGSTTTDGPEFIFVSRSSLPVKLKLTVRQRHRMPIAEDCAHPGYIMLGRSATAYRGNGLTWLLLLWRPRKHRCPAGWEKRYECVPHHLILIHLKIHLPARQQLSVHHTIAHHCAPLEKSITLRFSHCVC